MLPSDGHIQTPPLKDTKNRLYFPCTPPDLQNENERRLEIAMSVVKIVNSKLNSCHRQTRNGNVIGTITGPETALPLNLNTRYFNSLLSKKRRLLRRFSLAQK